MRRRYGIARHAREFLASVEEERWTTDRGEAISFVRRADADSYLVDRRRERVVVVVPGESR